MKAILPAILSCQSIQLLDEEKKFFAEQNPLGLNLFARNIHSASQLKKLISDFKNAVGRDDVIIAVDQEGGRVRRLPDPEFRSYAAAADIGALPDDKAELACRMHALLIAADLQELGINVNYAPVLDIAYPQTSSALLSRCFSADADKVFRLGQICVDTYREHGIAPCIKHMPGHGRAAEDPHLGLPRIDTSLAELEQDIFPFRKIHGAPLAMTAHIIISAVDKNAPVTHSAKAIKTLIRDRIGFDGLLVSDAIDMQALQGTPGTRASRALKAGCDCVCYALGDMKEMTDIAQSCPPMSDKALERFEKLKKVWNKKVLFANIDKTAQNYQQLMGQIPSYHETYDATEVLNKLLKEKHKC